MSEQGNPSTVEPSPIDSAIPPVAARALAVAAILVGGLCGGLIGYSVTNLQCDNGCTTLAGAVGVASAVGTAVGVAIVAVLTLRAMAEWDAKQARERSHRADQ